MAHNPEVAGSNPAPATMKTRLIDGFFVCGYFTVILRKFDSVGVVSLSLFGISGIAIFNSLPNNNNMNRLLVMLPFLFFISRVEVIINKILRLL